MTTTAKLSKAQASTLATIARNGGEMNGFAGQKGFYCNSEGPLERAGLIESVGSCVHHAEGYPDAIPCDDPRHTALTGQKGGEHMYDRIRITQAGREALAAHTA